VTFVGSVGAFPRLGSGAGQSAALSVPGVAAVGTDADTADSVVAVADTVGVAVAGNAAHVAVVVKAAAAADTVAHIVVEGAAVVAAGDIVGPFQAYMSQGPRRRYRILASSSNFKTSTGNTEQYFPEILLRGECLED
jgi:hypothetical protein